MHPAYHEPARSGAPVIMPRPNLLSLLNSFGRFAKDPAVVETRGYRRESLTYAELRSNAFSWARVLVGHGVGPGDRVLLWGPNSSAWIAGFWATLLRGAVAVPMDASANLEFVQRIVREAQVKAILHDAAQPAMPGGPPSLVYNDLQAAMTSCLPLADSVAAPGDQATRTDVAEILFTSGTTSEPRGVVLTHGNFLANLEPIETGIQEYQRYERWFHPLRFVSV